MSQKNKIAVLSLLLTTAAHYYTQEIPSDTLRKSQSIDEVVISVNRNRKTEAAVLGEQKRAVIQKQAISSEEISRKGISNVEQGLVKVTGITAVEGRGLFVRGLEERYTYLLINGLGAPSNNPFQKIVSLNQFPTDVVGKLNIYKTFNSNLYGDFAGATFDIETISQEKEYTKIEFGIGINTLSSFRNRFLIAEGASGMTGYLGLNERNRRLPSEVRNNRPNGHIFSSQNTKDSFKDGWNVDETKSLPNTSIGFITSQRFKINNASSLGMFLSLNQSTEYGYREGVKNQFKSFGNAIVFNNELLRKQYNYDIETSALLGLNFKHRNTNLNFNAIFLQNSTNIIEDYTGYKNNNVQNKDIGFFRTNQQDISRFVNLQLIGSTKINDRHQLKAGASYVINRYQQPDRKILEGSRQDINGNPLGNNLLLMTYGGSNIIRQYLDVNSKFYASAFAEYSLHLGEKNEKNEYPFQINVGYNGFADIRKNSYRFIFAKPGQAAAGNTFIIDRNKIDQTLFNDAKNGLFYYQEESDPYISFSNIYQFVNAGYISFNYKPTEKWDILIGGRYEKDQSIIRYNAQGVAKRSTLAKDRDFLLPSISIKNAINSKQNIRFSASKTITRPVIIETMPITYINPDNEMIVGNPNVKNSENINLDLKWEWFPTSREMVAVNLFAKKINNAIERSFKTSGDANGVTVSFLNAQKAIVAGIELEGIFNLKRIDESLKNFSIGANATLMYSNVDRSDEQLLLEKPNGFNQADLRKRGLQGLAPYTINADLKYERKNRNNQNQTISLVYNVSGSKIYAVGSAGTDNFYERPFHQLDFVYQEQLNKHWNIKFGIQNILNYKYQIQLGDHSYLPVHTQNLQYTDFYRGTNFKMSVGYTF